MLDYNDDLHPEICNNKWVGHIASAIIRGSITFYAQIDQPRSKRKEFAGKSTDTEFHGLFQRSAIRNSNTSLDEITRRFCDHVLADPESTDIERVHYYVRRPEFSDTPSSREANIAECWLINPPSPEKVRFYFRYFCSRFWDFDSEDLKDEAWVYLLQKINEVVQVRHRLPLVVSGTPEKGLSFSLVRRL